MLDGLFTQNDILGTALRAAAVRNDVIANNIANADTPGFKARGVAFEDALRGALDNYAATGTLDLTDARPRIGYVNKNYHYRLDENNVDIETEMAALYRNSVRYDALTGAVVGNSRRINLVLTGR
ncbi:MAG: flagellar basal body rod protein FlgB [Firmicutes bacterium]|nr:flagellar basal body rod protein FlgB [Bacillota bacterium]